MTTPLARDPNTVGWEQTIHAFLAEKERRSGSRRTVKSYSRMLYQFFGSLGKPPGQITAPEVFGYAHGVGLSGKKPSSVTIGARIACLSSFYRFLIRMDLVSGNPCDQLERPKAVLDPRGQPNIDFQRFKAARENTQSEVDSLAAELTQLDESVQLSASALMPCPFSTRGFQRASTTLRLAVRSNFQEDIEGTLYKYVREETSDPVLTGN